MLTQLQPKPRNLKYFRVWNGGSYDLGRAPALNCTPPPAAENFNVAEDASIRFGTLWTNAVVASSLHLDILVFGLGGQGVGVLRNSVNFWFKQPLRKNSKICYQGFGTEGAWARRV